MNKSTARRGVEGKSDNFYIQEIYILCMGIPLGQYFVFLFFFFFFFFFFGGGGGGGSFYPMIRGEILIYVFPDIP